MVERTYHELAEEMHVDMYFEVKAAVERVETTVYWANELPRRHEGDQCRYS